MAIEAEPHVGYRKYAGRMVFKATWVALLLLQFLGYIWKFFGLGP
jgi:hypothetical protein